MIERSTEHQIIGIFERIQRPSRPRLFRSSKHRFQPVLPAVPFLKKSFASEIEKQIQ